MNRRQFVGYGASVAVAAVVRLAGGAFAGCGLPRDGGASTPLSGNAYARLDPRTPGNFATPLALPRAGGGLFGILEVPDSTIDVVARQRTQELLKGKTTEALDYEVSAGGRTYLNPVFRARPGSTVSARLVNRLHEASIIHWHGLLVDWRNDGHPSYAAPAGATYGYQFVLQNRGGTYWYHPHPDMLTGRQTYLGLAGFFIVEDDDDMHLRQALDLELGVTDIPLLIQDKRFTDAGSLLYITHPMEQFQGFTGDVIVVNRTVNPTLNVDTRAYRFRVLNGSNARIYQLAFERGSERLPMFLIGTDGGLLPRPIQATEIFLGPAERADIVVDLRHLTPGDVVFAKSLPFDPMHAEMPAMGGMSDTPHGGHGGMNTGRGGTMMAESRLADGAGFNLLKLHVRNRVAYDLRLPSTLARIDPIDTKGAATRPFTLSASGMQWLINGERFAMERELFRTRAGVTEVWEISNAAASMPHPMHLHGFQFQVLERRGSPQQVRRLAVDPQARLPADQGWKDTVTVWPGETVRIAVNFSHAFGGEQLYLFHCHLLEHEDAGMMVNYRVA